MPVTLDSLEGLKEALRGVDYVYGLTVPGDQEYQQGINLAKACEACKVKLLVYKYVMRRSSALSGLPHSVAFTRC